MIVYANFITLYIVQAYTTDIHVHIHNMYTMSSHTSVQEATAAGDDCVLFSRDMSRSCFSVGNCISIVQKVIMFCLFKHYKEAPRQNNCEIDNALMVLKGWD